MDHNNTNNLYQKPEQPFDTFDFWNRTHFQYHGDPTLRLNQVKPVNNVEVAFLNGHLITWSASTGDNIIGYHVYRSYTENGPFQRLTSSPINDLSFTDPDLTTVVRYYIVKAIKLETTGSGTYLNPSIGVRATETLSLNSFTPFNLTIYPNPTTDVVNLLSTVEIVEKTITDLQGKELKKWKDTSLSISIAEFQSGVYFLTIKEKEGQSKTLKLIKQ
jgi:hypothetical protein